MKYRIELVADGMVPLEIFETVLKKYGCKIAGFYPFDEEEEDTGDNVVHLPQASRKEPPKPQLVGGKAKALLNSPLPNNPQQIGPTGYVTHIVARIPDGQEFTTEPVMKQMHEAGFATQASRNAFKNLYEKNMIERIGFATYRKKGDWSNALSKIGPSRFTPRTDSRSGAQVALDFLATIPDGSEVAKKEIEDAMAKAGLNRTSAAPVIGKLLKDKNPKIEKIGMSLYRVRHAAPESANG